MTNGRKYLSTLLVALLLMTSPCPAEEIPEPRPGVAYMDQCSVLPSACLLLFVMTIAAGIGAWLLLRNSSGHNFHSHNYP